MGGEGHYAFANKECHLAYVDGFLNSPRGANPDGDESWHVCPFLGKGAVSLAGEVREQEIRSDMSFMDMAGAVKLERLWCRTYFGQLEAHVQLPDAGFKDVCFSEVAPRFPYRFAAAGDWMLDHLPGDWGWTEIHEARITASILTDPDCDQPRECDPANTTPCGPQYCDPDRAALCEANDWHFLTQGFFAENTWQQELLALTVSMPLPRDASGRPRAVVPGQDLIDCGDPGVPAAAPAGAAGVGCSSPEVTARADADDSSRKVVFRAVRNEGPLTKGLTKPDGVEVQCSDALLCPTLPTLADGSRDYSGYDKCNASTYSNVAFAGDFVCRWKDPVDVWMCETCRCGDPSAPGAFFSASAQGYVSGLDPANPADAIAACNAVCGGFVCGGAQPSCEMNACSPPPASEARARLVAGLGGEPPPPITRISDVANYTVELIPALDGGAGSLLEVGTASEGGAFAPAGGSPLFGSLRLNLVSSGSERQVEFAGLSLRAAPFSVVLSSITNAIGFSTYRFAGRFTSATEFRVPRGQFNVGVRATIDGDTGGTPLRNEADVGGRFDALAGTFELTGSGRNEEGKAARFRLVGRVTNFPPVAVPGPDRQVECQSPTTTPVVLDGAASMDPDPGDSISHYQWFEGGRGLSNRATVSPDATFGRHLYELHVYDRSLASAVERTAVTVVDTTPPVFALTSPELCLWPPNHTIDLIRLGRDITFTVQDTCDTSPDVRIVSVEADEPALTPGSGNTSPDTVFGPTAACVRAERSGPGDGRRYAVKVRATDASGNFTEATARVFVPHDASAHPRCRRAVGLDEVDPRCRQ